MSGPAPGGRRPAALHNPQSAHQIPPLRGTTNIRPNGIEDMGQTCKNHLKSARASRFRHC